MTKITIFGVTRCSGQRHNFTYIKRRTIGRRRDRYIRRGIGFDYNFNRRDAATIGTVGNAGSDGMGTNRQDCCNTCTVGQCAIN